MARRGRSRGADLSARYLDRCQRDGSEGVMRLFSQYSNLARSRYRWENLPKGMTSRNIEKALFEHSQVFFFEDESVGLLCLPCSGSSVYNVYGDPISVNVFGYNYNETYQTDKGVRILDNDTLFPLVHHVMYYSEKMEDLEYSINTNIQQQNNPYIFSCTKNAEMSIKNIFNKIRRREPAIFYDADLGKNVGGKGIGLETTDISRPYVVDKYRLEKHELEKELLELLGINCVINKNSGMNVTELNSNNLLIDMYIEHGLQLRLRACEEINKKFGLNINVVSTPREMKKIFSEINEENKKTEGEE